MWKSEQVANWFLVRQSSSMSADDGNDENLTQMKLHKLMYYAQGVNLAVYSKRLFDEEILAWKHGPVIRSIYDLYQGKKEIEPIVDSNQINDFNQISADEESNGVLEVVYEKFGIFSAAQLRKMTHNEKPWIDAWMQTLGSSSISDKAITDYFRENIVDVG